MVEYKNYEIPSTKEELIEAYKVSLFRTNLQLPNIPFNELRIISSISLEELSTAKEESEINDIVDRYVTEVKGFIDNKEAVDNHTDNS